MMKKETRSPKYLAPKRDCTHLLIRDVPQEVHRAVKSRAALQGVPIGEWVIQALRTHLRQEGALS
jgi:predicted HicB family RNase H-like nuclease